MLLPDSPSRAILASRAKPGCTNNGTCLRPAWESHGTRLAAGKCLFGRPTDFPTTTPTANSSFVPGGIFIALQPNLHTTAVHQWNLGVQRQFGQDWVASATYAGSETEHLWVSYQLN